MCSRLVATLNLAGSAECTADYTMEAKHFRDNSTVCGDYLRCETCPFGNKRKCLSGGE